MTGFQAERYLGTWYEIARLDHSFERGMSRVTAEYTRRDDGGLNVLNRGYVDADKAWKQATGKAYFVDDPGHRPPEGVVLRPLLRRLRHLRTRPDRTTATRMVSGPDTSYLWLLARSPTLDAATKERLVQRAKALGFDTSQLIFVEHGPLR